MKVQIFKRTLLTLALGIFIASCAPQRIATKRDYDFSKIKRIAVLGFSNHRDYRNSGDVVSEEFILQLISKGMSIIERSRIDEILKEQKLIEKDKIDYGTVKAVGQLLGVDVVITGAVVKYKEDRKTTVYTTDKDGKVTSQITLSDAEVEISARMIDVGTGEIVWSGKYHDVAFDVSDAVSYVVSGLINSMNLSK